MQKLKNLLTNFKEKFLFTRVNLSQINETVKFINKNSKANLNRKFYLAQYLKYNQINSFICQIAKSKKIIAHVGYVKYLNKDNTHYTYSRHSSIVNVKFRGQKIYSNLVEFSLKNLNVNDSILLWPNNNNKKHKINSFLSKYNYNISNHFLLFQSINEIKLQIMKRYDIIKKYLAINNHKNIIFKNLAYFRNRYFYKDKTVYFYHEYKNSSIAIFTVDKKDKKDKKKILLDIIGNATKKNEHLKYLARTLSFYCCIHDKKIEMFSKIINIKFTRKTFNIFFLTNKKINLKNYDINLGDTDSFLNTNF